MSGSGIGLGTGGIGGGGNLQVPNFGPRKKPRDVNNVTKVAVDVGKSGMVYAVGETKGAPDVSSPGTVPYTDVLSNYKKAAENTLSKEKVPPAYRKRVKDYFSSLE
jgi:hypothetical protein